MNKPLTPPVVSFFKKNALLFKAAVIATLVFILMIPMSMISALIWERESRHQQVIQEISAKWGSQQTICGPIVTVPYYHHHATSVTSGDRPKNKTKRYAHFLPDDLVVNGQVYPEHRHRSIFEVVLYNSQLNISGDFSSIDFDVLNIAEEDVLYDEAFISLGISDLRGVEKQLNMQWNDDTFLFNAGIPVAEVLKTGIHTPIAINPKNAENPEIKKNTYKFSCDLYLKGSQNLFFVPVGKETETQLASTWTNPSFNGDFLPDHHEITNEGFTANWNVLHLNRNFPQSWLGEKKGLYPSAFGVNLLMPIDGYQKTTRSIKYAILFIGLTFLVFFFIEVLYHKSVHPLQYILIGLALVLFYSLLLSISEYLNFNIAYLIAAFMTIALVALYTQSIFKNKKLSGLMLSTLVILYGFIFTTIQVQDYALLMGSLGLFMILASTMYFSRKIDWDQIRTGHLEPAVSKTEPTWFVNQKNKRGLGDE